MTIDFSFPYAAGTASDNVLIYYKGSFEEEVLSTVGASLRKHFDEMPKLGRSAFASFVEMAQNISLYSEERNIFSADNKTNGIGTFLAEDLDDKVKVTATNLVNESQQKEILAKVKKVNEMELKDLKMWRREILRKPPEKEGHQGGGIGLLEIVLKSGSPLDVEISIVNQQYAFLSLSVYLNK
ncbi:SiaB family protein kinase [Limibacter armeniacum]|uniref:SiaB family protein kinase n=1 Tax=Limibacter armeniacum TaxID=466084 RepID=UPI002FE5ED64